MFDVVQAEYTDFSFVLLSRFMISFMVVVLPEPLGPIKPVMKPLGSEKLILFRVKP